LGFSLDTLFVRAPFFGARRQLLERPAQAFVADDLGHAQYLRRHFISAQSGDMSIAPLAIQNR
jgi:hypothetical protein